jgi:hypothetical protein
VGQDFNFVYEGPAAPVVLIGNETQWEALGELEWTGSDAAWRRFPLARICELNQELIISQQQWQVWHWRIARENYGGSNCMNRCPRAVYWASLSQGSDYRC